ncbi:MAG: MmgE/PrpD family protein [Nitrospinota bacterium]
MPARSPTATEALCAFSERLRFDRLPAEVAEKAKLLVLDILGIALAARSTPIDAPLRGAARALMGAGGPGAASAVGEREKVPPAVAALLNGALGHSLDYDDTHTGSIIHTAAPVVPAALAGAEEFGRSGGDFLRAVVAGFEAEIRIGLCAPGRFHERGFHMTSIAGTFGAALAYGLLAGLEGRGLVSALGISGSQASGLFEYLEDGSPVKALHPGWAAHSGIAAASLARGGMGGPATVLEGRFGLLRSHLGEGAYDAALLTAGLGERWETLATSFKPYPCGHVIHAFLDAAARLQGREKFSAGEIEEAVCHASKKTIYLTLEPAEGKLRPRSGYEGKFSLPYCLASIFVRGKCGVDEFTEDAVRERSVLEVASRVRYVPEEPPDHPRFLSGKVEVRLRDGRSFLEEERCQRGAPENPLSSAEIRAKFFDNARRSLPADRGEELAGLLGRAEALENLDRVGALLRQAEPLDA